MSHMLTSALAALLLLNVGPPPATGLPSWSQFWLYRFSLGPIAVCTSLNIGLNNASLTMVSLFVNQVIKACAPLPSMIFSYLFANKRYSYAIIASVLSICAGSVLADFNNLLHGVDSKLLGVVLCLISLLANALKPVIAMLIMDGSQTDVRQPFLHSAHRMHPTPLLVRLLWCSSLTRRVPAESIRSARSCRPR